MQFTLGRIFKVVLTALLSAAVFAIALNRNIYGPSFPAYSVVLVSALVILAMIKRSWLDLSWVMVAALLMAGFDYGIMKFRPHVMPCFAFVGLGAMFVLGTRAIWAESKERWRSLNGLISALLLAAFQWVAFKLLIITSILQPKTFDLYLYSFDCSLRVQPSFVVGQLMQRWRWLYYLCIFVYAILPLPLALVYAAQLLRSRRKALQAMLAFLVMGPLGFFFYSLLPACGPRYLFGADFPWHPLPTSQAMRLDLLPVVVHGFRNAIPSLHMAWALLIWWNSRDLPRWIRTLTLSLVVLTALPTLGTGEHYFVDLVVAFPFSVMVQALCSYTVPFQSRERRTAFLFGMLATLLWFALLSFGIRFFWISPVIPWAMIVATVVLSLLSARRLMGTETQEHPARLLALGATA